MTVGWILVGACIGIGTGLLGIGASIVTVLLLIHVAGLTAGSAVATSLVVVAMTSLVALVPYGRTGAVMWKAGAALSVASMTGAFLGGRASSRMPARALVVVVSLATLGAAIAILWPPLDCRSAA